MKVIEANSMLEKVIKEWTTKAGVNEQVKVEFGKEYILKEVSALAGYELASDIHFRVTMDGKVEVKENRMWKAVDKVTMEDSKKQLVQNSKK